MSVETEVLLGKEMMAPTVQLEENNNLPVTNNDVFENKDSVGYGIEDGRQNANTNEGKEDTPQNGSGIIQQDAGEEVNVPEEDNTPNQGEEKSDAETQQAQTPEKTETFNETPRRKQTPSSSRRKPTFNSITNYEETIEMERSSRKKSSKKSKSKKGSDKQSPSSSQPSASHKSTHKDDSYYIKLNNSYFSNSSEKNETSDTDLSAPEDFEEITSQNFDAELSCIKEYEGSFADISWRWRWLQLNIANLSHFLVECEEQYLTLRNNKLNNNIFNNSQKTHNTNNTNGISTEPPLDNMHIEPELHTTNNDITNNENIENAKDDKDNVKVDSMEIENKILTDNNNDINNDDNNNNGNNINNNNDNNINNFDSQTTNLDESELPLRCRKHPYSKNRSIIKNKTFFILRKRDENSPLFLSQKKIHEIMEFNRPLPKKSVNSKHMRKKIENGRRYKSLYSSPSIRKSAKYKSSRTMRSNSSITSPQQSPSGKKKFPTRRTSDFNINNVVLPSFASPTQIRKINYKEIFIPDFRIVEGYFDEDVKPKKYKIKNVNSSINNTVTNNNNNNNNDHNNDCDNNNIKNNDNDNNKSNSFVIISDEAHNPPAGDSSSENTDDEYYEELHRRKEIEERKRYCIPPKKIRKKKISLSLDSIPNNFENDNKTSNNETTEEQYDITKNPLSCSTPSTATNFPDTFYVTTNQFTDSNEAIETVQKSPSIKKKKVVHSVLLSPSILASPSPLKSPKTGESKKRRRSAGSAVFWEVNKKIPPIDEETQLPKIIIYLKKKA